MNFPHSASAIRPPCQSCVRGHKLRLVAIRRRGLARHASAHRRNRSHRGPSQHRPHNACRHQLGRYARWEPRYPARAHQPLVEVLTPLLGNVNHSNSTRWSGTSLGARLRYLSHEVAESSLGTTVEIVQTDPASGLVATCNLTLGRSSATVHATTTLSLPSDAQPLPLWGVTTLALGAWLSEDPNNIEVWSAACTWGAENRWTSEALRAPGLVQTDKQAHGETCRGAIAKTSYSTWSSGEYLPLGVAVNGSQGGAMAWQIEHNGPWRWELGERPGWYLENTIRVAESEAAGPPQ